MGKLISNHWTAAEGHRHARIVEAASPEGVEVGRREGTLDLTLDPTAAHVFSVISGRGTLDVGGESLALDRGTHVYVPLGTAAALRGDLSLVHVTTPRARGERMLLRHERFLSACATPAQTLRWVLTPQYLSRRIFLHHDAALLSPRGEALSWFHTTMFDVTGLPPNAEGESVFKMEYDSRTEINVCYDVLGEARVRYAAHPYSAGPEQAWTPWGRLDDEATYLLDETAEGPEAEHPVDPATGAARVLRNRHEVFAAPGGHVTLLCMLTPSPVGIEQHVPGEYSDYEPLEAVARRPGFSEHQAQIHTFDRMVDRLSLARARGQLQGELGSNEWALYREGRAAQAELEARLLGRLSAEGRGREGVVARWTSAGLHHDSEF